MSEYIYHVHTDAVVGLESEFERWYEDIHIDEVMRSTGIVSGRRYRLVSSSPAGSPPKRWLAVYRLDIEDPAEFMVAVRARIADGSIQQSATLDPAYSSAIYEAIGPDRFPTPAEGEH